MRLPWDGSWGKLGQWKGQVGIADDFDETPVYQ